MHNITLKETRITLRTWYITIIMHFTVVVADMYTSNQCLPTYIPSVVTTSQDHLQISRLSEKL